MQLRRNSTVSLLILSAAIALLLSAPVTADTEDDATDKPDPSRVWTDSVVVTASRVDQNRRDVAANVTVLDATAIQHSAALTVDDMLRQVPGFSLFRRSSSLVAHPTSQGVSLRGIGPSGVSRTLVLLDGIPQNDPFGGWVYWSRIPKAELEKVEVVRGGGSNLWGNSALGGVIQLFTQKPEDGLWKASFEAGNKGIRVLDLAVADRWNGGAFRLSGSAFETDGYYVLQEAQRGAIDIPAYSEHDTVGGSASFDLAGESTLTFLGSYFDEERGNGTFLTGNATESFSLAGRVDLVDRAGGAWEIVVRVQDQDFASAFSSQAADRNSENPALDQFDVPSESVGGSLHWIRPLERDGSSHLLTSGLEYRVTEGETNEQFFFSNGSFNVERHAGGKETLGGVYFQDTWSKNDWQLQFGARVDRWETRDGIRRETVLATDFVRREDLADDRSETEVSPRLSLLKELGSGARLRGSVYRSFRAPTINELFRPFRVRSDITEANAALVPETLNGIEVGIDVQGSKARADFTLFHNQVFDPIANVTLASGPGLIDPCGFVPSGGTCRQRLNLDETSISGFEAAVNTRLSRHWQINGSLLITQTEIEEAKVSPVLEGLEIAQVPENQLVVQAVYSNPKIIDFAVQGRWVDDQFEDDLNQRTLESFTVVDVSLSRQITERWGIFLRGENIFDEEVAVGLTGNGLLSIGAPFLIHGGVSFRRTN